MSKGKNFSCNDLGQRIKDDAYGTPYSLTRALLEREDFEEPVLEPACGEKAMVKVVQVSLDLRDYFAGQALVALINNEIHQGMNWNVIAVNAYGYAEGMLLARKKEDIDG